MRVKVPSNPSYSMIQNPHRHKIKIFARQAREVINCTLQLYAAAWHVQDRKSVLFFLNSEVN